MHQRRDDLDLLMRAACLMEVVLLQGVQQAGNLALVVPHHALVLDRLADGICDVRHKCRSLFGGKDLVERDLASNGRGHLWLHVLQVLVDVPESDTSLTLAKS